MRYLIRYRLSLDDKYKSTEIEYRLSIQWLNKHLSDDTTVIE